jgi:predicted nucleotidyltransferase
VLWPVESASEPEDEMTRLSVDRGRIIVFCLKHHIRKLAFFGSVVRGDFQPGSDIDVLVEFEPEHVPGLAFFTMEEELSQILGQKVDLNTPQFLSPYFRSQVEKEAETQYEQA